MPSVWRLPCLALVLAAAACGDEEPMDPGPGARSTHLTPRHSAAYYVEQANEYFDTLDTGAAAGAAPKYSPLVARWEWPPWLYLTGYERDLMISSTKAALLADPSTVPKRECKAFDVQPFARCYVTFKYKEGTCPIYEEFTFNDRGEMTFLEAWSNLPGKLPTSDATDRWAQGANVKRLSTRIPGLGNPQGRIDLDAAWMKEAATADVEVADFVARAKNFWDAWFKAYNAAGKDLYARGCGWK